MELKQLRYVSSMSTVEVITPVTLSETKWRHTDDDLDPEMVAIRIDYLLRDHNGNSSRSGSKLKFEPLQIRKGLLERLITLGLDPRPRGK
jgi:hypothetical protein